MQPSFMGGKYRRHPIISLALPWGLILPRNRSHFQSVIGREAKQHLTGQDSDALVACVGGGSNAIGFIPFVEDESVAMYGA